MCGITGCIVRDNKEYASIVYSKLVRNSDIRGQDGTGITLLRNGEFKTLKWCERAKDIPFFISLDIGDKIVGQNRYAIFGLDHTDDQPLINDYFALVHNGVLYNYEEQFKESGFRRELKVDTELILRYLEHYFLPYDPINSIKKVMEGFEGEGACLVLTTTTVPFLAFMKNKILYSGQDMYGNTYFFSTMYIKNKIPEICENIREFENGDVEVIY
jgi:glutamine phosphoribosylpyrophosphate amidotransferase